MWGLQGHSRDAGPGGLAGLRQEMWNPLHESDSAAAAMRRPRWLCAGALVLAAGLLLGFLFDTMSQE